MALTYAIEGKGVIANADGTTDTAGGTWSFTGSGGVANGNTTDTFYYGTSCMTMALSGNGKNGWLYHDIGSGNELDFGASGTEENQFIYVWIHCPTIGLSATLANEGVSIRVGSSTSDYRIFVVAGSNGSNGWDGKWKCFVIDPTKAGSITDVGTPNLSSIRYIGIRGQTTATAKGDNFFISQIAVGSGIRITGDSTTAWLDAVNYCTDLPNRAWGMLQEREGIFYAYGNIIVGDTAMTANCSFSDSARVVQFGLSEYWSGTGTTFNTALPTTACGITLEDDNVATAYTTTFTDGVIVGTDNGRSGTSFIGNANEDVFLDFSGLANTGSDVNLYGTTFQSLDGPITLEGDADHAYLGVGFIGCSQVNPVGAPKIRNCTFAETSDVDSALLWNESIDIEDCSFIANTVGAAIEHPSAAGTPYTYTNLTFSGNTFDGLNTSGSNITVNNSGSDAATDEGANTITYQSSLTLTMEVLDDVTGLGILNAQCSIYLLASPFTELMNEDSNSSGIATQAYTSTTPTAIKWRARKSEDTDNPRFFPQSGTGTITAANGFSQTVRLKRNDFLN